MAEVALVAISLPTYSCSFLQLKVKIRSPSSGAAHPELVLVARVQRLSHSKSHLPNVFCDEGDDAIEAAALSLVKLGEPWQICCTYADHLVLDWTASSTRSSSLDQCSSLGLLRKVWRG